jgi:hypothetical protein
MAEAPSTTPLVDPDLGLIISSGKFTKEILIEKTVHYNADWTDKEKTVIFRQPENETDTFCLKSLQETVESNPQLFDSSDKESTDKIGLNEIRISSTGLDLSKTLPDKKDSKLTFENLSDRFSKPESETDQRNLSNLLLEEVRKIAKLEKLGLKVFCNVPIQDVSGGFFTALGNDAPLQLWPLTENLPMIIVQKDSILLLDEFQKNGSHDIQFNRLDEAELFLIYLLQNAFDYLIPVSAISKVLCFSEEDDRDFKGKRQLKEMLIQEAEYKNVQLLSLSEGRPSNDGSFISVKQLISSKKTESTAIQLDAVIAGIVILYYRLLNDDCEEKLQSEVEALISEEVKEQCQRLEWEFGIKSESNFFLSEQSGVQLLSYRGQDQEDTFTTEHGN